MILIVENDVRVRDVTVVILQSGGYQVSAVANGKEALRFLENNEDVELVLTDIVMPLMDSFDLFTAARVRPNSRSLPFLVMTGGCPRAVCPQGSRCCASPSACKRCSTPSAMSSPERRDRIPRGKRWTRAKLGPPPKPLRPCVPMPCIGRRVAPRPPSVLRRRSERGARCGATCTRCGWDLARGDP